MTPAGRGDVVETLTEYHQEDTGWFRRSTTTTWLDGVVETHSTPWQRCDPPDIVQPTVRRRHPLAIVGEAVAVAVVIVTIAYLLWHLWLDANGLTPPVL